MVGMPISASPMTPLEDLLLGLSMRLPTHSSPMSLEGTLRAPNHITGL